MFGSAAIVLFHSTIGGKFNIAPKSEQNRLAQGKAVRPSGSISAAPGFDAMRMGSLAPGALKAACRAFAAGRGSAGLATGSASGPSAADHVKGSYIRE